eukprot:scaffold1771_cov343-Pavlova_lutheri.AAC.21
MKSLLWELQSFIPVTMLLWVFASLNIDPCVSGRRTVSYLEWKMLRLDALNSLSMTEGPSVCNGPTTIQNLSYYSEINTRGRCFASMPFLGFDWIRSKHRFSSEDKLCYHENFGSTPFLDST